MSPIGYSFIVKSNAHSSIRSTTQTTSHFIVQFEFAFHWPFVDPSMPTGNSWTSDGKQLDFRRDTPTGYTDGTPSRFVIRQPFEGTPTGNSWTSTHPPPSLFESIAQTINHFIIRFGFPSIDHAVAHPIFLRIHLIHESIRLIRWDTDTTTPPRTHFLTTIPNHSKDILPPQFG